MGRKIRECACCKVYGANCIVKVILNHNRQRPTCTCHLLDFEQSGIKIKVGGYAIDLSATRLHLHSYREGLTCCYGAHFWFQNKTNLVGRGVGWLNGGAVGGLDGGNIGRIDGGDVGGIDGGHFCWGVGGLDGWGVGGLDGWCRGGLGGGVGGLSGGVGGLSGIDGWGVGGGVGG